MREAQIQSKITEYLRKNNIEYNKLMSMSKAGWPDLITVKNGVCYFFEVKQPGGKTSMLQESVINRLNKDRQIAFVVKSVEKFIEIWEGL